jgi:hypothetical protein
VSDGRPRRVSTARRAASFSSSSSAVVVVAAVVAAAMVRRFSDASVPFSGSAVGGCRAGSGSGTGP